MRRILSFLTVVLVGLIVLVALPAVAQEDGSTGETVVEGATTETTLVYKTPAVSVAEAPAEDVVQPWTIRYLVPTTIVLAGVLVFGTVIQYFLKVVRTRYKTVE